jgi:hypothetical protein
MAGEVGKAKGQTDKNMYLVFQLLNTAGTPSVVNVSPAGVAADISCSATATGRISVTIKNCLGPQGFAHIQATPVASPRMSGVVSPSYSGADLTFEIKTVDDTNTAQDTTVNVRVEVY